MKLLFRPALLLTTLLHASMPASADNLSLVTEILPPYQILEQGELHGVGIDMVKRLLEQAELAAPIDAYPWARAYKTALTHPNVGIFPISRTDEREALFHWIGVIVPYTEYLWRVAERTDIRVEQLEDLYGYQVALVREDSSTQLLLNTLAPEQLQSELVRDVDQGVELLLRGRAELISSSEQTIAQVLASKQLPATRLVPVYKLEPLSGGLYLAVSRGTDTALLARLSQALEAIKADGSYQQILQRYGLAP